MGGNRSLQIPPTAGINYDQGLPTLEWLDSDEAVSHFCLRVNRFAEPLDFDPEYLGALQLPHLKVRQGCTRTDDLCLQHLARCSPR